MAETDMVVAMKKGTVIFAVLIAGVFIAVILWSGDPSSKSGAPASFKDATYMVENREITLVKGISETEAAPGSASKIVTRYFGNDVRGDVNGDGAEDIAFILTQGGSGGGKPKNFLPFKCSDSRREQSLAGKQFLYVL